MLHMFPTPGFIEIRHYQSATGDVPYSRWLSKLDPQIAERIETYVDRMKSANFGNTKLLSAGVFELKINFGSGFRVYFIRDSHTLVVLLCAGDKGSQHLDIRKAQTYASDYWRRK